MKIASFFGGALAVASWFLHGAYGQDFADHKAYYTEPHTGIKFWTTYMANGTVVGDGEFSTVSSGGYQWGIALPPNAATVNSYEYIGMVRGSLSSNGGWAGVLHGDNIGAAMSNHLMLIVWPNNGNILTSFRYSPAYADPAGKVGASIIPERFSDYTGTAKLTQIYTEINSTSWMLIYRCQDCYLFNQPGQTLGNMSTTVGHWEQGWSQSSEYPLTPANPFSDIVQHDNGMGEFSMVVASATQASYSAWATLTATGTVVTGTATSTSTVYSSKPVPTGVTYDYVVIGGGAAGVPIADKLSEAGHTVLLIEKGPASSGRWGGTLKPAWLDGTNLTRFDVPGLCNEIWVDSAGIQCYDTDQMAGCVLGGGTAVNAGLWWKPNPSDWDVNFPVGWKSTDMAAATTRVFTRIPGTDHPSSDGLLYLQQGFAVVSKGLANAGWQSVTPNNVPASKNRTYGHTPYMFMHGERGGPLQTYLVTANGRTNFHMWLTTAARKVVRSPQGHATGVLVEPYADGGYAGTVNLTPNTGRVILAAGTFGTAKLLFRSGIGPTDQLQVVQSSTDGPTMINSSYWINLPVGYNLDDHCNTDTVISHPSVVYYDWYGSYNTPNTTDENNYLKSRIGPLTQAAPDIGPMFWEEITGADGIVRQLQWTARVEGSLGAPNGNTMTMSQYLGRGATSRGRTTIQQGLNMVVSTLPYLNNQYDIAAVVQGVANLQKAMNTVANLTWISPAPGQAAADYVANTPVTWQARRANHWMGSCKIGLDDGRVGGTAVVDTNTKLYGSDNIFVVDASIWPGMPSTNPSALIVVAAEHASEKILALAPPTPVAHWGQCGGTSYSGSLICVSPYTCQWQNPYYSQCL